jgi:hypothetical protein
VILLENLNKWNLFPAKRRIIGEKKEWSKDLKAKEVKPHMKSSRLKKREDEIYKLLGEILSKERKEIIFFYSEKFDVWPHPYPYIICICTTFYSLTFPFLTPIH